MDIKIKLNGQDRLAIPKILPEKGGMLEQLIAREIIEIVKIKSKEFEKYGIEKLNGALIWDEVKINKETEFNFNSSHISVLKDAVKNLMMIKK